MKVIVVSYHYLPEITPRAFRASSIYSCLNSLGYDVELVIPPRFSLCKNNGDKSVPSILKTLIRKAVQRILPGGKDLRFFFYFISKLSNKQADMVISIGLPFSVHLAVAVAIRFKSLMVGHVVFDYGDPYSLNPYGGHCFYAKRIEKWALKYCDTVLTPTDKAVGLYRSIAPDSCDVKVITQGYDLNMEICEYKKNDIPTFAYAGMLYKGIREPLRFLKHIAHLNLDFKFVVFTNIDSVENIKILNTYIDYMKGRLEIIPMIPRVDCIKTLSKMDFLINFDNLGGVQTPSKIVDYSISGRPFVSIDSKQIEFDVFDAFLCGDYSSFMPPDISEFDQEVVVRKIAALMDVK